MDLVARVEAFIAMHGLLQPGQRLVAAVSGGADSLCLMDVLHRLGHRLIVASLDHQLRPGSADDCRYVERAARGYTQDVVIGTADVRARASQGGSLEEAARQLRYRFLVEVAQAHDAAILATGHTADDQVETILMHLLRGAGPEGLRGMRPSTSLSDWPDISADEGMALVRPLLDVTRTQTRAYCAAVGLTPRDDPTNLDRALFRNRLRHELLPALESYNPRVREGLLRLGHLMAEQAEFVDRAVSESWDEVVRPRGRAAFGLNLAILKDRPEAVQRVLARRVVLRLRPRLRDLGWEATQAIRSFAEAPPATRHLEIVEGLELFHLGDEVVMAERGTTIEFPEYPQLLGPASQSLPVPGAVDLAAGWRMISEEIALGLGDWEAQSREGQPKAVLVDAERLHGPMGLRGLQAGDRIRPLGMAGATKVADLLVNERIPRPARPRWPIVVANGEPVWVAGLRLADDFRLTETTRRAIRLRLEAA